MTLSIVREQGSSGDVKIHFQTRPALYQPPSNQATEEQDYLPRESSILMINGATVALVTVTILPVRNKKKNNTVIESDRKGISKTFFTYIQIPFAIDFVRQDDLKLNTKLSLP